MGLKPDATPIGSNTSVITSQRSRGKYWVTMGQILMWQFCHINTSDVALLKLHERIQGFWTEDKVQQFKVWSCFSCILSVLFLLNRTLNLKQNRGHTCPFLINSAFIAWKVKQEKKTITYGYIQNMWSILLEISWFNIFSAAEKRHVTSIRWVPKRLRSSSK